MVCRDLLMRTTAKDIMQPCPTFVSSHDLVTRARAMMRTSGDRTLPVVDGGRLVGIITLRQILRITSTRSNIPVAGLMLPVKFIATPITPVYELIKDIIEFGISSVPIVQNLSDKTVVGIVKLENILRYLASNVETNITVESTMNKKVVTCKPDDEISIVWNIMEKNDYSGLPVIRYDKQKRLVEVIGMITRSDIIRSGTARLAEESDKGHFRTPPLVRNLMRTPAITVAPDAPLNDAIKLMLKHNVGRLPVIDDGNLVGIISRSDVIKMCR